MNKQTRGDFSLLRPPRLPPSLQCRGHHAEIAVPGWSLASLPQALRCSALVPSPVGTRQSHLPVLSPAVRAVQGDVISSNNELSYCATALLVAGAAATETPWTKLVGGMA